MRNSLGNPAKLFIPDLFLLSLPDCLLLLFEETLGATLDIVRVTHPEHTAAAFLFLIDLLYMDNHIRCCLNQEFIMRNKQNNSLEVLDHVLQPFQRSNINIVGRLIQ